jgi:DNA processing protein
MKYLYAFTLIDLGPATLKKLWKSFGNFKKAWSASESALIKAGLKNSTAHKIKLTQGKIDINKKWEEFQENDLEIITINDEVYPQQLREIKSAPFVLFCWGNVKLLRKKQLAVIGTRRYTEYGKMVVEKIVPEISQAGIVITSGMAQGIDSLAHTATMSIDQPTIAVLGAGILETYKNYRGKQVIDNILSHNGLIISEYPPFYPASKYTFPARNRIVSGLSLGTLVIEAGKKSGTMITVNYALEQNREVFAIPGNIFSDRSTGTHHLIKEGAQITTSANDILEVLNFAPTQSNIFDTPQIEFTDPKEELIYKKLSLDPILIDKLAKNCKLDTTTVSSKLSLLEMKGLARNIGGGRFIKG